MDRSGATYLVVAITATPLQTEPSGPQVVSVDGSGTSFRIGFDSDLNPATVAGAVTVRDASGAALTAVATYDPDGRALVVTVASGTPTTLQIGTTLTDVDGEVLAAPYSTPLGSATPAPQAGVPSPGTIPAG